MDVPRIGIIASPLTILLASFARGQAWIGDGAQFPVMTIAVLIGLASFAAFTARRNSLAHADPLTTPDDDAWPCIACGYDVRHMPERCPECGTLVPPHRRPLDPRKLRDDWPLSPIEPRQPADHETLVRAWDAPNSFAATLFTEQLRARGIKTVIRTRLPSMRIGEYVTPSADHAVFVYSEDVAALSVIMERLARDPLRRATTDGHVPAAS